MNIPYPTTYFEDMEAAARASLAKAPGAALPVDPYALLVLLDHFKNPTKTLYVKVRDYDTVPEDSEFI